MKKIIFLFTCIFVFLLSSSASLAASSVVENPNIRIVIEGKQNMFSNTPVTANSRTMLPLREILTKLGVDDGNIVWSAAESSVTIKKDNTKIYLKVGSNTAYVNDNPILLDAAPVNYASRVFIPVRFVADSLNKKVVWDDGSKTVFIREMDGFNATRELLEKVNAVTEPIKKYKFLMDLNTVIASKAIEMSGEGETDFTRSIMHIDMGVLISETETKTSTYLANNAIYSKMSPASQWKKQDLGKDKFDKLLNSHMIIKDRIEMLAAGMVLQQDDGFGDIVIKGDVFIDDILKQTAQDISVFGIEYSKMNLEIAIDRNSYFMKGSILDVESSIQPNSAEKPITQRLTCTYSDYNGDFEIQLPEEIK